MFERDPNTGLLCRNRNGLIPMICLHNSFGYFNAKVEQQNGGQPPSFMTFITHFQHYSTQTSRYWVSKPAELPVVFQVATFWVWMQHSKTLWVIFLQKTDQMKQPPGSSQPQVCNFIKKVILAHMSSCQFWEVFKNKFFTVHHWATAFEPTEQLFVNLWNFVVRFTAKKQTNKQYIYSFLWYTSSRSAY